MVKLISNITTFSKQHIGNLLKDHPEFKERPGAGGPSGVKSGLTSEHKTKRKPRKQTTDKQKLDNLYKKVEKSAFSGQGTTSQKIDEAKELGIDVTHYEASLENIRETLRDSIGKRYLEVKDSLNEAYNESAELKKTISTQIDLEKERIEQLKESLKNEVMEEAQSHIIEMGEEERINNLLRDLPPEFEELKSWAIDGFWGVEAILGLLNKPKSRERIKLILESGNSELIQRVKERKTSITYAYKKLIREGKHQSPPPLPEGEYDVIYADPPWQYDIPTRGAPDMHYPTMTLEEICDLKNELPIAEDTILFLWATNPKLPEALQVLKEWGFKYKTNLSWVKDKIGTGYYFRGKHELLLIGIKGKMPPPIEANRPPSVLIASRREHSQKPEEVYDLIETMYPNRKYLELFARNNRNGWYGWGDEQIERS